MVRIAALAGLCVVVPARRADAERDDALSSLELAELDALYRDVPDAVELLYLGERAMAEGNYEAAAERFAEARTFAPDAAVPARRHCEALVALDQGYHASAVCRQAAARGAVIADELFDGSGARGGSNLLAVALLALIGLSSVALATGALLRSLRRARRTSRLRSRTAF